MIMLYGDEKRRMELLKENPDSKFEKIMQGLSRVNMTLTIQRGSLDASAAKLKLLLMRR